MGPHQWVPNRSANRKRATGEPRAREREDRFWYLACRVRRCQKYDGHRHQRASRNGRDRNGRPLFGMRGNVARRCPMGGGLRVRIAWVLAVSGLAGVLASARGLDQAVEPPGTVAEPSQNAAEPPK